MIVFYNNHFTVVSLFDRGFSLKNPTYFVRPIFTKSNSGRVSTNRANVFYTFDSTVYHGVVSTTLYFEH